MPVSCLATVRTCIYSITTEIEPVHNETPEDYDWTKDVAKLGAYTLGSSYDNLLCSDIDLNDFAVIS